MKGGDSNDRISRDLDDFYHRSSRGSGYFIRAGPQVGVEVKERTLQGGLIMTEMLAYGALFVLAIVLLLTNQVALATVAIVPFVLTSFKYSFPTKKAQRNR